MSLGRLYMHMSSLLYVVDKSHLIYRFTRVIRTKDIKIIGNYKLETTEDDEKLVSFIRNSGTPRIVIFLDKETTDAFIADTDCSSIEERKEIVGYIVTLLKSRGANCIRILGKDYIEDAIIELYKLYHDNVLVIDRWLL